MDGVETEEQCDRTGNLVETEEQNMIGEHGGDKGPQRAAVTENKTGALKAGERTLVLSASERKP